MADEILEDVVEDETVSSAPKRTRNAPAKTRQVVEGEVIAKFSSTMTTSEYAQYSKENGRYMGREAGQVTELSPEEFVVLSQDNWTPKQIMDKHGIDLIKLQQVADRVPLIMQLKRRIVVTDKTIKW